MSTPFFDINNLSFRYEDGTIALKNINMKIKRGLKIALLGSNGAGKSTLFLHLNGLLQPSSGKILFNGEVLKYTRKQLLELRKNVGIVFQNPETQLFNGTVRDDIAYGPYNLNLPVNLRAQLIENAIAQTEVEELLDKPIHFLSLGQKKRVSIAGVLAMNPQVILLDEPTASLDNYYTRKVFRILNQIHSSERTLILSTHNISFAYEWADEVAVMHQGEILYHGDIVQLFEYNSHIVEIANLETPWMFEIGMMLKNKGLICDLNQFRSNEKILNVLNELTVEKPKESLHS